MLGRGGLCQSDLLDDIAANTGLPRVEHRHDADSRRMPQRLGERRDAKVFRGFSWAVGRPYRHRLCGHSFILYRYSTGTVRLFPEPAWRFLLGVSQTEAPKAGPKVWHSALQLFLEAGDRLDLRHGASQFRLGFDKVDIAFAIGQSLFGFFLGFQSSGFIDVRRAHGSIGKHRDHMGQLLW